MNICRGGNGERPHDEIVHDEACCPLCIMRETMACEIAELEEKIEVLKADIMSLGESLDDRN